jgi:hypothetical protein
MVHGNAHSFASQRAVPGRMAFSGHLWWWLRKKERTLMELNNLNEL